MNSRSIARIAGSFQRAEVGCRRFDRTGGEGQIDSTAFLRHRGSFARDLGFARVGIWVGAEGSATTLSQQIPIGSQAMPFAGRYSALAQRLNGDSSGVWAVHERACAMRSAGEDVYLLSVGDPDLPTLPSTVEHAIQSLRDGRTHYAPGAGERRLRPARPEPSRRATI